MNDKKTTDRLPPDAPKMEQGVLGCILVNPKECLPEVVNRFKGNKQAFYDHRHQVIFEAVMDMQNASVPIEIITLQQKLSEQGLLENIGGIAYLNDLEQSIGSAANLEYYLTVVFDKWVLRRAIQTCTEFVEKIYGYEGETSQLIAEVQSGILNLPTPNDTGPKPIKAFSARIQERIEHYARGIGTITGLPTGFRYWDRMVGGLHPGDVIILGGDPGAGKTSLAMNVAERVAMDGGNAVGVMSLEMSAEDLILRLACSRARVNFHKLRTGMASETDLQKMVAIFPSVMNAKIILDDSGGLTMHEVRSRLRGMKHRHGIRLAIVDYLQLISLTKEQMFLGAASGYADVARGLQQASKELQIPIIILSQLSNEGRKRGKTEKPKLTDFRETSAIGDVANFAGILWRPPLDPEDEAELREAISKDPMGNHVLELQMEVVKNKNGPSGMGMMFEFMRWCMRFEDLQYKSKPPEELNAAKTPEPLPTDEELGYKKG
jgi:replicative DNA helicase